MSGRRTPVFDESIPDAIGKLALLFFRAEADKQRVFRDDFVRQMHRAAVKLHLLLQAECDCGANAPGHHPFTSQCERAALAELAAHTKEDPEGESPYARIAATMLRQRPDATGGEGVSP